MTRYFDPGEDAFYSRVNAVQQTFDAYRQTVTPDLTAAVTGLAQTYPHVDPGTVMSLAQAGVQPGTQLAEQVSQASMAQQHHGWAGSVGSWISGGASAALSFTKNTLLDDHGLLDALKPVVRGATTVLQAPYEYAQAGFRDRVAALSHGDLEQFLKVMVYDPQAAKQTTGFIAAEKAIPALVHGRKPNVDMGSGFFPAGQIRTEQQQRARAAGMIDGHAITPGRFLASHIVEPGTTPYNILSGTIDGAVAWFGDPASKTLKVAGDARKAKLLFTADTGLVDATRRTVLPEKVDQWLAGPHGQQVTNYLAQENDFQRMWESTGKKIPVPLVTQLVDARTPEEVQQILRPALGVEIRQAPTVGVSAMAQAGMPVPRFALRDSVVSKNLSGVRLLSQMPGRHLDLENPDAAVEQLDRVQRNARLNPDVIAANNERMARATTRIERFNVVKSVVDENVKQAVLDHGGNPTEAGRLTKIFTDYDRTMARYFVDEVGNNMPVPGAVIGGDGLPLPTPHLFVEYINRTMPLPDARAIRTATSKHANLLGHPTVKLAGAAGDFLTQTMFKPLALLRGAWTVRVVGEEQVRMGAAGLDSVVAHPLSALSYVVGQDSKLGRGLSAVDKAAAKLPGVKAGAVYRPAQGATDLAGATMTDAQDFSNAMSRGSGGWRDTGVIRTKYKTIYQQGDPQYPHSWAQELQQLHSDPIAQRVAGGLKAGDRVPTVAGSQPAGLDAVKEWFWSGAGRGLRGDLAAGDGRDALLTRQGADGYIDSVQNRIRIKTGDHPDLINAVTTGKIGDHALAQDDAINRHAVQTLRDMADNGHGPQSVKGDVVLSAREKPGAYFFQQADRAVEYMFNTLMSRPTNYLSRSSAFKQFYWQRAEELLPFMTADAQKAALANAEKANLGEKTLSRLRGKANAGQGTLAVADADLVAKGHALDETRKLLYDLHDRSQFFDTTRLLFPFGEAWKEILTVWARIGRENPQVIRRVPQIVNAARGSGFFYTDQTTGQEMFAYPGSDLLTKVVAGVPVKLQAPVSGLNLFSSSFLPGFGPVVTMPAGALIPDTPSWDQVRKIVLPYGEQDTKGGFVESMLPAWLQKLKAAQIPGVKDLPLMGASPKLQRQYANTVTEVMRYLASTGSYDTHSYEGQQKLLADAKSRATRLMIVRGAAQYVSPSAPSPQFVAVDKTGSGVLTQRLAQEYRAMQQQDYTTATQRFIDKFGEGAFLSTISKTQGAAQPLNTVSDFARQHPSIARQFPNTYSFFAAPGGTFDITAEQRQLDAGERQIVTPEEALQRANQRLGQMVYAEAKAKVGDNPSQVQRQWLRDVQDSLREAYHGYDPYGGYDPTKTPEAISELTQAVKNPTVARTDAGQGLTLYLEARAKAQQIAQNQGFASFGSANRAAPIRAWLRQVGDLIGQVHPGFQPLFDQVLDREMVRDTEGP